MQEFPDRRSGSVTFSGHKGATPFPARTLGAVGDAIDDLIEEVTVDAYGDDEQLYSFQLAFEERARFPFSARVVGVEVVVTSVEFDGSDRRGLIAVCRRAGERHAVSLLDISPAGPLPLETRQLLDAYRRWSGATPFVTTPVDEHATSWTYPRFAPVDHVVDIGNAPPLALRPRGDWDPTAEYWGEPEQPIDPMHECVIAAGGRPCFEMEQVLPGVDDDDWDSDPIVEAVELHRLGRHRQAIRQLEGLLAIDRRCVDAWGHLGLIAFETRGPGPAAEFYETGIAVAEQALPAGFAGVLPRGWIDNRPFLRCLHGLALCAWRQRRWADAEAIFTARVWLDPTGSFDAVACLEPVRSHERWTRA